MNGSNSKGDLIARLAALGQGAPSFETQATGPAHDPVFSATVTVDGQVIGQGEGRSRREAERLASAQALGQLGTPASEAAETPRAAAPRAPWPIYAPVLAQAIEAALDFADEAATLDDIRHEAAQFYRQLLADLGHHPEVGA